MHGKGKNDVIDSDVQPWPPRKLCLGGRAGHLGSEHQNEREELELSSGGKGHAKRLRRKLVSRQRAQG